MNYISLVLQGCADVMAEGREKAVKQETKLACSRYVHHNEPLDLQKSHYFALIVTTYITFSNETLEAGARTSNAPYL